MRLFWVVVPVVLLGLAGCVSVERQPQPQTTVVTPSPATPTVVTPPGSAVITRP